MTSHHGLDLAPETMVRWGVRAHEGGTQSIIYSSLSAGVDAALLPVHVNSYQHVI